MLVRATMGSATGFINLSLVRAIIAEGDSNPEDEFKSFTVVWNDGTTQAGVVMHRLELSEVICIYGSYYTRVPCHLRPPLV